MDGSTKERRRGHAAAGDGIRCAAAGVGIRSAIVATALLLASCTGPLQPLPSASPPDPSSAAAAGWQTARIVAGPARLECVPHARKLSGIAIRGDAWTWWRAAEGRYARAARPEIGAVLVLARSRRLGGGHLAVVTGIVGPREIVVEHANWLNRGRIHKDAPVQDVSPGNDWSAVRVWYTPGGRYGTRTYPAHGFILPAARLAAD